MQRTFEVNLPSGATVIMRPMTLKEQDRLLASKGRNVLTEFVGVLNDCTVDVASWGVYGSGFPMGDSWDWRKTFEGDFFTGLILLRAESLGDLYPVRVKCPSCGRVHTQEVHLGNDLAIIEPPDETKRALESGSKVVQADLEALGVTDLFQEVNVRLLTIGDLIAHDKSKKSDQESILDQLYLRLQSVDGLEAKKLRDYLETEISLDVGQVLLDIVDSVSFGVDTTLELDCPHCGYTFDLTMPFQDSFFRTSRHVKRRASRGRTLRGS